MYMQVCAVSAGNIGGVKSYGGGTHWRSGHTDCGHTVAGSYSSLQCTVKCGWVIIVRRDCGKPLQCDNYASAGLFEAMSYEHTHALGCARGRLVGLNRVGLPDRAASWSSGPRTANRRTPVRM